MPKWGTFAPSFTIAALLLAGSGCKTKDAPAPVLRIVETPGKTIIQTVTNQTLGSQTVINVTVKDDGQKLWTPPAAPQQGCPPFPISEEQKAKAIERFRKVSLGTNAEASRMLLFINRELVDEETGLNLAGRGVSAATTTNGTAIGETNSYHHQVRTNLTLVEKQGLRDMEAVFMRPFREAKAVFVDQRLAAQMLSNLRIQELTSRTESEAARKDREALARHVDVVIELLVEFKPVPGSADQTLSVPEIHATAVRLKDAQILGHGSSSEAVAPCDQATVARCFSWREITEGTSIKLMEDMTLGAK